MERGATERTPAGWYPDPDHPEVSQRFWDGASWTDQRAPIETRGVTLTPRVVLAGVAAVAVIMGVFLPRFDLGGLDVSTNTLIAGATAEALALIAVALGGLGAAYRDTNKPGISWAPSAIGLILVGLAIYLGSPERIELETLGVGFDIGPGSGVYAIGLGGGAMLIAGLWGDRAVARTDAERSESS